jgi:hypothetical protein
MMATPSRIAQSSSFVLVSIVVSAAMFAPF